MGRNGQWKRSYIYQACSFLLRQMILIATLSLVQRGVVTTAEGTEAQEFEWLT